MATTIEKFVFECKNPFAESDDDENDNEGASETKPVGLAGGIVQDFTLPADARIVYVKINNHGHPAFYAMVDDSQPMVTRRFAAFPSRTELPPNFVYVGTSCDGRATFHVGEVITTN